MTARVLSRGDASSPARESAVHFLVQHPPETSLHFVISIVPRDEMERLSTGGFASLPHAIPERLDLLSKPAFFPEPRPAYSFPVLSDSGQFAAVLAEAAPQGGPFDLVVTFLNGLGGIDAVLGIPLEILSPGAPLRLVPPESAAPEIERLTPGGGVVVDPQELEAAPAGRRPLGLCYEIEALSGKWRQIDIVPSPARFTFQSFYAYPYYYWRGYAENVYNPCTGGAFSDGFFSQWFYTGPYIELDSRYCGKFTVGSGGYSCNYRFQGTFANYDSYLYFPECYYHPCWSMFGHWQKVASEPTLSVRDAATNVVIASNGTTFMPILDRRHVSYNIEQTHLNIEVSSSVSTVMSISSSYDGRSAGHAHAGRPLNDADHATTGTLGAFFSGPNAAGDLKGTTYSLGAVPENSPVTFSYRTTGFAGVETLTLKWNVGLFGELGQKDFYIRTARQDLQELEQGTTWINFGQTTSHPSNHFGTPAFNTMIRRLATNYFNDSLYQLPQPYRQRFRWNDQSLPSGGPFEWRADWNNKGEHQYHREGHSVDLSFWGCYDGVDVQTCRRSGVNDTTGWPFDRYNWVVAVRWFAVEQNQPGFASLRAWNEGDHTHVQVGSQ